MAGSCGTAGSVTLASNQIAVEDLAGAFAMIAIGIGIAIIIILVEVIFNCWIKDRASSGIMRHVDRFLGRENDERV